MVIPVYANYLDQLAPLRWLSILVRGCCQGYGPTAEQLERQGVAVSVGHPAGHTHSDVVQDAQRVLSARVGHRDALVRVSHSPCIM